MAWVSKDSRLTIKELYANYSKKTNEVIEREGSPYDPVKEDYRVKGYEVPIEISGKGFGGAVIERKSFIQGAITEEGEREIQLLYSQYTNQVYDIIKKEARKEIKYKIGQIVKTDYGGYIGRISSVQIKVLYQIRSYLIVYNVSQLNADLTPYKRSPIFSNSPKFQANQEDLILLR